MLLSLLPFAGAVFLYFYKFIPSNEPSILAMLLKCLPIWCLSGAAFSYGKTFKKKSGSRCHVYVTLGLLASSIGDACLIWDEYFPHGMLAFAIAHCFYICAFGFNPLGLSAGFPLYLTSSIILSLILPHIKSPTIFFGMPFYSFFLTTMAWRAIVQGFVGPNAWHATKVIGAVGAVLFLISDLLVSFHDLQFSIPHGQVLIMSTYYAAQFFIALSIYKSNKSKKKKSRKDSSSSSST